MGKKKKNDEIYSSIGFQKAKSYFVCVEKGLDKKNVIGEYVYEMYTNEEIGKIESYNKKTGFMNVKLVKPLYCIELMMNGIRLDHITFEAQA